MYSKNARKCWYQHAYNKQASSKTNHTKTTALQMHRKIFSSLTGNINPQASLKGKNNIKVAIIHPPLLSHQATHLSSNKLLESERSSAIPNRLRRKRGCVEHDTSIESSLVSHVPLLLSFALGLIAHTVDLLLHIGK
jgi:hypothetical protein